MSDDEIPATEADAIRRRVRDLGETLAAGRDVTSRQAVALMDDVHELLADRDKLRARLRHQAMLAQGTATTYQQRGPE